MMQSDDGGFAVVVRLTDGDAVQLGVYTGEDVARRRAEELVAALGAGGPQWPYIAGRYVRPDAVVSVDVVHSTSPRWTGSTGRAMPWSGHAVE